jgi:hypothetical protein
MNSSKVIRDFSSGRYSDSELGVKASHVIKQMTGNQNFPNPAPTIDEINTANNNYITSLNKVVNGSKEDTVIKNNLRRALELLLKLLTDYVQTTSGGDEAIILSSGFDVSKKHALVGPLAKATGLTINLGNNKGSVMVECQVVSQANFYEFEYTEVPSNLNSIWLKKTSTKHKLLIDGLTSGKQYAFRVAGAGSDPSRSWSDEIASFVL